MRLIIAEINKNDLENKYTVAKNEKENTKIKLENAETLLEEYKKTLPNAVEEIAKTETEYNNILSEKNFNDNSWNEYIEKYSQDQINEITTEINKYKDDLKSAETQKKSALKYINNKQKLDIDALSSKVEELREDKKKSDKKETVPNANYLWIGYFATALNKNGKAALVMANSASDASGSEYDIRKKMIKEGIISQMVTLPSNMFSSVTLPATLWFFDKQKPNTEKKNEILFIDARNVFTQVDRAHRKFSDEQIKNLGVITKLYHGDTQALADLIDEYKAELVNAPESSDNKEILTKSYWQSQIDWLTERFPDGVYTDVIGLCKVAPMDGEDGIIDQNYSLNAGRYVGVVIEDDGLTQEEFKEEMYSLNSEFSSLSIEARKLEELIKNNLKGLLGERNDRL